MKKVLTIAGSDPCGGAGIQADLKTFHAFGVYGMSVVTAVTAQNTKTFDGTREVPPKFVALQIDSVMKDIGADAWKTGMLVTSDVVKTVVTKAKQYGVEHLIVDPVMVSKTGKPLLVRNAINVLEKKLIPLAFVVTPNIDEAQVLTGIKITSISDMKKAAVVLHKMGARHVVVKGGHFLRVIPSPSTSLGINSVEESHTSTSVERDPSTRPSSSVGMTDKEVIDILFDGNKFHEFRSPRIKTRNTHGTGCVFASAIAAELAKGKSVVAAVAGAKDFITLALQKSTKLRIGHGNGSIMV